MIPVRIYLRHIWQLWDEEVIYTVLAFLAIFMIYGFVGSLDYADQKAQEAERHQQARNETEQAFIRCLNGGWVAQTDKVAIVCDRAWEILK